jgi:hypothetical protein
VLRSEALPRSALPRSALRQASRLLRQQLLRRRPELRLRSDLRRRAHLRLRRRDELRLRPRLQPLLQAQPDGPPPRPSLLQAELLPADLLRPGPELWLRLLSSQPHAIAGVVSQCRSQDSGKSLRS